MYKSAVPNEIRPYHGGLQDPEPLDAKKDFSMVMLINAI